MWVCAQGELPQERKPKRRRVAQPTQPKPKPKKPKFHALKHVLVNEKRDKKSVKYMADVVPYPFKTREQYERSLRNPIGQDWNTVLTTEALHRPEVTSKMGQLIEPMKYAKPVKQGSGLHTSVSVKDPLQKSTVAGSASQSKRDRKNKNKSKPGKRKKQRR